MKRKGFAIELPSNSSFNSLTQKFDKTAYEFQFVKIQKIDNVWGFNDVSVPVIGLDAGDIVGEKTYYLVSQINNITTRYNVSTLIGREGCVDRITEDKINIKMNGTLFIEDNIISGTNVITRQFLPEPVVYDTCACDGDMLPVKKV